MAVLVGLPLETGCYTTTHELLLEKSLHNVVPDLHSRMLKPIGAMGRASMSSAVHEKAATPSATYTDFSFSSLICCTFKLSASFCSFKSVTF